jgi:hypothetical protein
MSGDRCPERGRCRVGHRHHAGADHGGGDWLRESPIERPDEAVDRVDPDTGGDAEQRAERRFSAVSRHQAKHGPARRVVGRPARAVGSPGGPGWPCRARRLLKNLPAAEIRTSKMPRRGPISPQIGLRRLGSLGSVSHGTFQRPSRSSRSAAWFRPRRPLGHGGVCSWSALAARALRSAREQAVSAPAPHERRPPRSPGWLTSAGGRARVVGAGSRRRLRLRLGIRPCQPSFRVSHAGAWSRGA